MVRFATLLALALAGPLALAGCSDPKAPTGEDAAAPGPAGANAEVALPQWAVRDWWTFTTTLGDATYVVTADAGADWFMDTTDPLTAFRDARTDVSRLGPTRKTDLAGSQHDDRVQYFDFPLKDNATWETRWDGVPVDIVANDRGNGRFEMVASNASYDMYRYTYDARVGWFREFNFLALDGSPAFTMTLRDSGHNFTGTAVRWQLTEIYSGRGASFNSGKQFEVPAGVTDLHLQYSMSCAGNNGGFLVAVQPVNPPGQGYQANGQCTGQTLDEPVVARPAPGTWAYVVDVGASGGESSLRLIQRVLEEIAIP